MSRKRAAKPAAADIQAGEVVEQKSDSADVGGRPEHEPTLQERLDVRLMKADDWSDERIARRLGIARNTLRKHFAQELEDGADHVRATALRNLMRASNKGNVSASRSLLQLAGLVPPAPVKAEEGVAAETEEKLGKKELARRAALTAEEGTSWHQLLKH